LRATARLVDGRRVTAVELQRIVLEAAWQFDGRARFEAVVPRARELLTCWTGTLDALERKDWGTAARRLDWVLKLALLERVLSASPGLAWCSSSLRMLDQLYASLDPAEGLYWACESAGTTDRIVSESSVVAAGQEPPPETRAWARAHLLRLAGPGQVDQVDWDHIRFRLRRGGRTARVHLRMANPLGWTRRQAGPILGEHSSLQPLLSALGGFSVVKRRRRPGRQGVSHVGT
jgi:proteasome accessory factor A